MSAAASRLALESPSVEQSTEGHDERETLQRLTGTSSTSSARPIIAVDLDDVLGQTNQAIADCKYLPL